MRCCYALTYLIKNLLLFYLIPDQKWLFFLQRIWQRYLFQCRLKHLLFPILISTIISLFYLEYFISLFYLEFYIPLFFLDFYIFPTIILFYRYFFLNILLNSVPFTLYFSFDHGLILDFFQFFIAVVFDWKAQINTENRVHILEDNSI